MPKFLSPYCGGETCHLASRWFAGWSLHDALITRLAMNDQSAYIHYATHDKAVEIVTLASGVLIHLYRQHIHDHVFEIIAADTLAELELILPLVHIIPCDTGWYRGPLSPILPSEEDDDS